MDASLKKILKSVTLELRHLLEGRYDAEGKWKPGDLEERLAAIGVRRDKESVPVDELDYLSDEDKHARKVVDAYIQLREEADVARTEAVAEFVRETAYTWANRLLALRCMESRDLIDEVILKKEVYGGRSLEHHRLAQRQPELCAGEDDGLFTVLDNLFEQQTKRLPMLFDPQAPGVALRPSAARLRTCIDLLSLQPEALRKAGVRLGDTDSQSSGDGDSQPATLDVFKAPDALGWAYQYWNTEEKDRVFEKVRTVKGAKIEGSDIVPATQLYTESYMVQFLVQNSLGATWMGMHPESKLFEDWDYYVRDADRAPVTKKPVRELTFLDPACGSGHFLLEAFDLFYAMYEEEGELTEPQDICDAILNKNLYGIDIDARSIQIAEAALWMKAAERAFDYEGFPTNLVAAVSSHLKGPHWEEFLASFEKEPSIARVLRKFGESMEHIDELGSLARPNEDLKKIIAEEHAVWEQQVREEKEANFLFPEMRKDATSGKLPFNEISDEDFGDRLFYRARAALDAFTEQARERGDFEDHFLGREIATGFTLLNVLDRLFDVVAANPPYMGSRKMGSVVKKFIGDTYREAKRDIYAAFIMRNCQLIHDGGRVAMITLHSWMFLNSYSDLRPLLLAANQLESIAHLGRHAFSEADPPGNAAMIVFQRTVPEATARITAFRMTSSRPSEEQASLLKRAIDGEVTSITCRTEQSNFEPIPNQPIVYWIHPDFFRLLTENERVAALGGVKQGLATGDNTRHLRFFWEVPHDTSSWQPYAKGGGYCKWFGLHTHVIDWRCDGVIYKTSSRAAVRNPDTYFQSGITYTLMARGSLGLRLIDDSVYDVASMSVFPEESDKEWLMGVLNCRLLSYLARVVSQDIKFNTSYVSSLPLPDDTGRAEIEMLSRFCVDMKRWLISLNPVEATCSPASIYELAAMETTESTIRQLTHVFLLHSIEGVLETLVVKAYAISAAAVNEATQETGLHVGCYPIASVLSDTTVFRELPVNAPCNIAPGDFIEMPHDAITEKMKRLQEVFAQGPGAVSDDSDDSDQNDDEDEDANEEAGAHIPIRAETFAEELCEAVGLHPVTTLNLLRRGIEVESWTSAPLEELQLTNLISVATLQLLGHQWEHEATVNDIADADGVIPVSPLTGTNAAEETLTVRLRKLLQERIGSTAAERLESSFERLLGTTLETWLRRDYFVHHVSQFKKRPVAWHIETRPSNSRSLPAYSAFIYCQKVDVDLLPKLLKQAEDLRKSFSTELRGISSTSADSRSDRQSQRLAYLEDAVSELQKFDDQLDVIIESGFCPQLLVSTLQQHCLDDAVWSLKAAWLRRLSALLVDSDLPNWKISASAIAVHDDFPGWVSDSLCSLSNHCATVGIKPPKIKDVGEEPTSADLAKQICAQAKPMMKGSLNCACDVWWKQFDDVVLGPLKEQVKEMKSERAEIKARLDADPAPEADEVMEFKLRDKQLREDLKPIEKKIKTLKAKATKLRDEIEAWSSDEPLTWETWLAEQPLFDHVASIDGKKAPPKTIAEFVAQESAYIPDLNDGVRVNIAPLQKAGILAADVLAAKDVDKAIADRAEWRADERRWVREGKLPQPGWWPVKEDS